MNEIKKFLCGPQRNAWLKVGTMKVYVRKGNHAIDKKVANTFDIANVEQDEKYRGHGGFRQLIVNLKKLLSGGFSLGQGPIDGIYIENLLNERLANSLS